MKIKNKKLLNFFVFFLLFLLLFFFINYGNIFYDSAYRNNTIYFPVNYNFSDLKENPFSQVEYDWGWSNSRWLGAIIESKLIYPNINNIYELKVAKIIGIIINIISAFIFFNFLKKINISNYKSFVISACTFSLPGFLYFNFIGTLTSHITYFFVVIIGYALYFSKTLKTFFALTILFFFLYINLFSISIFNFDISCKCNIIFRT